MVEVVVFNDRTDELAFLEDRWKRARAELLVVYGRRRVGKSELLLHFAAEKPHVYFLGDLRSERDQLAAFTEKLHAFSGDPLLAAQALPSWSVALEYLVRLGREQRILAVIDEFQYLCDATPALPSILQRVWDEHGRHSRLLLVLCGSYVSFMEREVLAYQSPLYGRRTGQMHLEPLTCLDAAPFLVPYGPIDVVQSYAVLGGMPGYLAQWDTSRTVAENIATEVLAPRSMLRSEARFLLVEELREPRNYFSILRAISWGKTRLNEIAQEVGLSTRIASRYLDVLREMGLVERKVPVTQRHPERSRQGSWQITDNYLAFWFRFVYSNETYLQDHGPEYVLEHRLLPALSGYTGPRFEEVCRQYLRRHMGTALFPNEFERIGAWWHAGEEMDVVAVDGDRVALVAECKWTNEWMKIGELNDLRRRVSLAGFPEPVQYALFSRSGFDPNLTDVARAEGVSLFGVNDLFKKPARPRRARSPGS